MECSCDRLQACACQELRAWNRILMVAQMCGILMRSTLHQARQRHQKIRRQQESRRLPATSH